MQPVHYSIGSWAHIGRALHDISEYEKHFFPAFTHLECAMCAVTMLEKCLEKQGEIPEGDEKNENCHDVYFLEVKISAIRSCTESGMPP
jgi:hypothetical protein